MTKRYVYFFKFSNICNNEVFQAPEHFPPVAVHHSKLSLEEAHRMTPDELWEFHAKELVAQYGRKTDTIKFLAVTNATRYLTMI